MWHGSATCADPWHLSGCETPALTGGGADGEALFDEGGELIEGEDGGGVGGGFFRGEVDFDEQAVGPGGGGGFGEGGVELALGGGGVAKASWELGGVGGIHEDVSAGGLTTEDRGLSGLPPR